MNKSIETIQKLALNPHYKLTEEEILDLEEWKEQQFLNRKHNSDFEKITGDLQKHNIKLEEE